MDASVTVSTDRFRPRSSKACLECRAAKVRCLPTQPDRSNEHSKNNIIPGECRRCLELGVPCEYTQSHRGRVKGSRNSRTMERVRWSRRPRLGGAHIESQDLVLTPTQPCEGHSITKRPSGPRLVGTDSTETCNFLNAMRDWERSPIAGTRDLDTGGDEPSLMGRLGKGFPVGPSGRQEPETHSIVGIANEVQDVNMDPRESIAIFFDDMAGSTRTSQRSFDHGDSEDASAHCSRAMSLPSVVVPKPESELLALWSPEQLQDITREQSAYFRHGIHGFKRDVAPGLDPVQQGLMTVERARELFIAYFTFVQPQWAILDPALHTFEFVQSRSALLLSTVLAVGSTALATCPSNGTRIVCDDEAVVLHSHVAKLDLIVHMTGARSMEILQAEIILSRYMLSPTAQLDETRWDKAARIATLASAIGLNLPHRATSGSGDRFQWNDLRVKAFLIINEWRISAFTGVPTVNVSHFELQPLEVEELQRHAPNSAFSGVPALYSLVLLTREARRRLSTIQSQFDRVLILETDFQWIDTSIELWIQKWCSQDRRSTWHLRHEAMCSHFQLLICLIGVASDFAPEEQQTKYRRRLLLLSIQIFQLALEYPEHTHMTHRAGIIPCVAAIILKWSDRRDLVLHLGLRMSGPPGKNRPYTFVRSSGHQMLVMLSIQHAGRVTPARWTPMARDPALRPEQTDTFTNPLDITFNSAFDFTLPYTANPSMPTQWPSTDFAPSGMDLVPQPGSGEYVSSCPFPTIGPQSAEFDLESFLQMTSALSSNEDTLKGILTLGNGAMDLTGC